MSRPPCIAFTTTLVRGETVVCGKSAGHDGNHWGLTGAGRDVVWDSVTLPARPMATRPVMCPVGLATADGHFVRCHRQVGHDGEHVGETRDQDEITWTIGAGDGQS